MQVVVVVEEEEEEGELNVWELTRRVKWPSLTFCAYACRQAGMHLQGE
ncbi:hypothetical protein MUK42_19830 [Musa troglodytarum]|uniref:Uncharacterized protein n=1 Tax=Musa troglodytarum TaxID=320322 RepID=A0A9E7KB46_9LILI|nr:hypothetical protein MUK42_19830 [Musa troglodytarum]